MKVLDMLFYNFIRHIFKGMLNYDTILAIQCLFLIQLDLSLLFSNLNMISWLNFFIFFYGNTKYGI
jgi:hypothetical protein